MLTKDVVGVENFVPYHSFDKDSNIFVQKDGSIGILLKLTPIETESLSNDQLGNVVAVLSTVAKVCPEGTVLQFILTNERYAGADKLVGRIAPKQDIFEAMARERNECFKKMNLQDGAINFYSMRRETYLAISIKPAWDRLIRDEVVCLRNWRSSYGRVEEYYKSVCGELTELVGAVRTVFTQCGVVTDICSEGILSEIYGFYGFRKARGVVIDDSTAEGYTCDGLVFNSESGIIATGEKKYAVLSILDLPTRLFAGILGFRELWFAGADITFVLSVYVLSQQGVKDELSKKRKFCFWQSNSQRTKLEAESVGAEIDEVLGEMFRTGEKVVSARSGFIMSCGTEPQLKKAIAFVASTLYSLGFETVKESALAMTLFLQSLPFGYSIENETLLKRNRKITTINLAHLMPVYGLAKGSATPDLTLHSRDGRIVNFSFFDSEVAPHGIIAGVSGSGKSVWSNNLVLSVLGRGSRVFVIDRGNSYKKLAKILGGVYIEFNPSNPVSINPFGTELDNEKHIFLTHLVAEMCTNGEHSLSQKDVGLISRSVACAYENSGGKEVLMSDIKKSLERLGLTELSACLEMFCGKGPYARFFDAACEFSFKDANFVVFELGELGLLKEIGSVILMSIINIITQGCMSQLGVNKYLIIDEAWTLLKGANTSRFLENVYRTYRKYRAAAIMVTQQITDFAGPVAEAIKSNAPNRVFLRQTPDTIAAMSRVLDLTESEQKMLSGLQTSKGQFSEAAIISDKTKGVYRLVLDRFAYWLMTSDPADNARLNAVIDKHANLGAQNPTLSALLELSKA